MARILWGLTVLALIGMYPPKASATTYSEAMTQCNQYIVMTWPAAFGSNGFYENPRCLLRAAHSDVVVVADTTPRGAQGGVYPITIDSPAASFGFSGPVPTDEDKCRAMPPTGSLMMAATSVCIAGCNYSPSDDGGKTFTVKGIDGTMRTAGGGTYTPTGATCGAGPSAPNPPTDPMPERKLCGGGSCHDVAAGKFCAVNGAGAQVCVVDKPPTGSPGGCVTMGDTTLCAGKPPPTPPNPPISDPVTDIAASDKYTEQTAGGVVNNTTVNNYNNTGTPPKSGATPDDDKPASSSSTPTPGDGTKAAGGGDCNSPPICEGAAATCMVVTQTYLLRCPPGGEGAGGDSQDGDTSVPGLGGIGETPGPGFIRNETLLDKLDTGGFGGVGACPAFLTIDIDAYNVHQTANSLPWCDILEKAGYILMLLAAFISYRILSEK